MANYHEDVDSLTTKLQGTSLPKECGVSFVGKGLKLDNASDAQPIVDEITRSDAVEFLNMEGNSLGVDAAKKIAKALEKRKEFKKALWKDMFTSRLKSEIPVALKHLTGSLMLAGARLEVLDLSDNASGPIGVEGFEDFLRSPSCYSLRELRLNNMGLGVTGAKKLARALMDLYNNSKNAGENLKLEVFIAGRNRLENPGATALAQVFQKIGTLREISIPQNGIYHVGVSALSEAFNENLSLEVINLNDNTVTHKGAKALSKVLSKLTNLKLLDLGDCLLRSEGATAIAESLNGLRNLESVNLSFNEVRGEAGSRVIESLAPLGSCLSSLNLDGNMFGPSLCEELASRAEQLKLPLAPLTEDEGDDDNEYDDDDDDDDVDQDDDNDEEKDEDEEEEDLDDTESDHHHINGSEGDKITNSKNNLEVSMDGISVVTSLLESLSVSKSVEQCSENTVSNSVGDCVEVPVGMSENECSNMKKTSDIDIQVEMSIDDFCQNKNEVETRTNGENDVKIDSVTTMKKESESSLENESKARVNITESQFDQTSTENNMTTMTESVQGELCKTSFLQHEMKDSDRPLQNTEQDKITLPKTEICIASSGDEKPCTINKGTQMEFNSDNDVIPKPGDSGDLQKTCLIL